MKSPCMLSIVIYLCVGMCATVGSMYGYIEAWFPWPHPFLSLNNDPARLKNYTTSEVLFTTQNNPLSMNDIHPSYVEAAHNI